MTTAWLLSHLMRLLATCEDPPGARQCLEEARAALASAADAAAVAGMVAAAERHLSSRGQARAVDEGLSERELGVLRLLATNLTQREIGAQLYLSLNTVKSHTRSIFRKLGVSSRDQAVARARELELISVPCNAAAARATNAQPTDNRHQEETCQRRPRALGRPRRCPG